VNMRLFERIPDWFGRGHVYWKTRRVYLFAWIAVITLIMGILVCRAPFREDVGAMLPDTPPAIRATFASLTQAPFLQMILVELSIQTPRESDALHASVDALAAAMQPPFFSKVVTGLEEQDAHRLLLWLLDHFPQLFTEEDAASLAALLEEEPIRDRLEKNLSLLAQPEGMVMKKLVSEDPLAFRELLLRKLRYVSVVPQARLAQGHFISPDGLHALIIAETPMEFTDVGGSSALLTHLQTLINTNVKDGVRSRLVCGHRYTEANARIIKKDLARVFTASIVGLLLVFLFFIRHISGVIVFIVPFFSVLFGLGVTSLVFDSISGITVGFGAVLLGITDYGLHVYFDLRDGSESSLNSVRSLVPPLLLCALNNILIFSILLFSSLPVQRQLAVFSISGLAAALLFALLVLPQIIPAGGTKFQGWPVLRGRPMRLSLVWLILLVAAAPLAWRVGFDGNVRSVGYIPRDAVDDEIAIRNTWGEVRDRSMAIAEGVDINDALQKNDELFAAVKDRFADSGMVSVAAFLPGQQTQAQNMARWDAFWNAHGHALRAKTYLETIGMELGYAPDAFEPFMRWIQAPRKPFDGARLDEPALARLLGPLIGKADRNTRVVTFLEDTPRMSAFFQEMNPQFDRIHYISDLYFNALINQVMSRDFKLFMSCAAVFVLILMTLSLRGWRRILLGMLPAVSGVVFMLAALTFTQQKLNLFNMLAAVMLMGLTADYGIVMLHRIESRLSGGTERAIFVSGLTNLLGFGALTLAKHPAMFSIGFAMVLGIAPAMLAALLVVPACARALGVSTKQDTVS